VAQPLTRSAEDGLAYVALGDSYTIGTSVAEADRWPNQLVARLPAGRLALRANLAVNGFTSLDVIESELPALASLQPGFVSLLIGVNDVVQGVTAEGFRANVGTILDRLVDDVDRRRIVVVSIPDYTLTREGATYGDPAERRAAIAKFNALLDELARDRGVGFVDIFEVSRYVVDDPSLLAADGLHPSAVQYRLWVDEIAPLVEALLRD
jgi:lysophospholipase L1-like esterase